MTQSFKAALTRAAEAAHEQRVAWMNTLRAAVAAIETRDGHIAGLERQVENLTRLLEQDHADRFGLYATRKIATYANC